MKNWRVNLPWPPGLPRDDPEAIEYVYEDDTGETKSCFNQGPALAAMLLSHAVFLNEHHWKEEWPEAARRTTALCVNTNDVFAWGLADAEVITYRQIPEIYRFWAKDPIWGTAVWAIIEQKQLPQRPVADAIRKGGVWDLDALIREHGLRANCYDGLSEVLANLKHEAYATWRRDLGTEPLPYDANWWGGWKEYIAANPDWNDKEWQDRERAAMDAWKRENGY